jgi:hypothetical protein
MGASTQPPCRRYWCLGCRPVRRDTPGVAASGSWPLPWGRYQPRGEWQAQTPLACVGARGSPISGHRLPDHAKDRLALASPWHSDAPNRSPANQHLRRAGVSTSTENQLSSTRDSQPHQHDMTERNGHLYPEADTAPRPAGRAVRHRSAGARKHRRAPASTGRAWSQRGPRRPRGRRERRR